MLRIVRLLKMMKVAKQNKSFQRYLRKLNMNSANIRMIQGMFALIVLTHLFACFWFLTGKFNDFVPQSWVVRKELVDEPPSI